MLQTTSIARRTGYTIVLPKLRVAQCKQSGRRNFANHVSSGPLSGYEGLARLHDAGLPQGAVHPKRTEVASGSTAFLGKQEPPLMGISVTSHSSATSIDQLVGKLANNTYGRWLETSPSSLEVTILLTPTYAHSALSSELPLQLLSQLGNGCMPSASVSAVIAVIDRLPSMDATQKVSEGLAYHVRRGTPLSREPLKLLQPSVQKPGSLYFKLPKTPSEDLSTIVQMPLAPTVFSTGLPSTLLYTHYQTTEQAGQLHGDTPRHLESHAIEFSSSILPTKQHFNIPLIPLTPARTVDYTMGNIVRKLSATSLRQGGANGGLLGNASSIPASEELEKAIASYFDELNLHPEPVQVWALIVPPTSNFKKMDDNAFSVLNIDSATIQRAWRMNADLTKMEALSAVGSALNEEIPFLLQKGARLCRVLSGGGGWGKKAGLLSLDPDTSYSTRDLRHDQGWEFIFGEDDSPEAMEKQQKQALGEVVKKGERILFFLAPRTDASQANHEHPHDHAAAGSSRVAGDGKSALIFGALPSSIDEVAFVQPEHADNKSETQPCIEHYENVFGVFSEGGMALELVRQQHGNPNPSQQKLTQTKLDVPFTRLSASSDG